ncbi:MAG TPA: FprA family A-type flavoprotein [Verrucomicrobiota bacterium]|nr:FprA family A-type flavoprotein [Verrucomicrobiota bacterium]
MKARQIRDRVEWVGAVDWNRRLFDALIPLPDGTSYNAYLVRGSERTVLIDTVDPAMENVLAGHLADVDRVDYVVSNHTEQDHSGSIPFVLNKYKNAVVLCTKKARELLTDHLDIQPDRIRTVEDGETVSLGDKTLQFVHTPWVHWPETMVTYLPEDRILFSCDFLGSHLATPELYAGNDPLVMEAAKRYYAEIMMPFRPSVRKNLAKVRELTFDIVAPSHGPIYDHPENILSAYADWSSDRVSNEVVMAYVSMHGSTEAMANHLLAALVERGVKVHKFELTTTDLGKLAMALVDAATVVVGTPILNGGAHPVALAAAHLVGVLHPKLKYGAVIGSYGWSTKGIEQIADAVAGLKLETLGTVLCKGRPRQETFVALDNLADVIRDKHASL